MTAKKTPAKRTIIDVAHPGQSAPSQTAKPVIVTNRPILKDPMMAPEATSQPEKTTTPPPAKTSVKPKLQPLAATSEEKPTESTAEAPAVETDKQDEVPKQAETSQGQPGDTVKDPSQEAELAEDAEVAAQRAALQKLIDSKQYFLPINTLEKRRTKRELILGVLLSILLVLAWLDIALDAGLVRLGGIKAVTHFFSS